MRLAQVRIEGRECRVTTPCRVARVVVRPAQDTRVRVIHNGVECLFTQDVAGMHAFDYTTSVVLLPGDVLSAECDPEVFMVCHWYVQNLASVQAAAGLVADGLVGPHTMRQLLAGADAGGSECIGAPTLTERAAMAGIYGGASPAHDVVQAAQAFAERMYSPAAEQQIAQMFADWASASPSPELDEAEQAAGIGAIGLVAANAVDRMIATRNPLIRPSAMRHESSPLTPPKPRPTRKVRLGPTAAEPTTHANPYLAEFNESMRGDVLAQYTSRDRLVWKYAWAVPNDAALDALAHLGPIVEVGAGTGYWAKLLRERGVDVRAFDAKGETRARYCDVVEHTEVELGGPEVLAQFPDRALFLCWPPLGGQLIDECLNAYAGSTLVLVGEGAEGCTGFSDQLEQWDEVERVDIPQWRGLHDYLGVWRRR